MRVVSCGGRTEGDEDELHHATDEDILDGACACGVVVELGQGRQDFLFALHAQEAQILPQTHTRISRTARTRHDDTTRHTTRGGRRYHKGGRQPIGTGHGFDGLLEVACRQELAFAELGRLLRSRFDLLELQKGAC